MMIVIFFVHLLALVSMCDAVAVSWTHSGFGPATSLITSLDGKAVYGNANGTVCKLSAATGDILWCTDPTFGQLYIGTTGELAQGVIAVIAPDYGAFTLDVQTGKVLQLASFSATCTWQWATTNAANTFYVALCSTGGLYAYNATLAPLWSAPNTWNVNTVIGTLSTHGDKLFIIFSSPVLTSTATEIFAFNMSTGASIMPFINMTSPMEANSLCFVEPNRLLVGGQEFAAASWAVYDTTTGRQIWNTSEKTYWENTYVAASVAAKRDPGVAYVFLQNQGINASLAALDVRSQTVRWRHEFPNVTAVNGNSEIALNAAGDTIYLLTQTSAQTSTVLYVFAARTGKLLGAPQPFHRRTSESWLMMGGLATRPKAQGGGEGPLVFVALGRDIHGLSL